MTIITKPISDKKADVLDVPLVINEEVDPEAARQPTRPGDQPAARCLMVKTGNRVMTATTVCLFLTALLVMSIGVITGVYLYRQVARHHQMNRFRGWCTIPTENEDSLGRREELLADSLLFKRNHPRTILPEAAGFKEQFDIDLANEAFERIDVPDFEGGRRGRFIHDFSSNKTGIIDLDGRRCFVLPLNRKLVLPPRSLFDLVNKMMNGYYEVDTAVVRETMRVVTPPLEDPASAGFYIARECGRMPTYLLERVTSPVYKRAADLPSDSLSFAEFAGKHIQEFHIIGIPSETETSI